MDVPGLPYAAAVRTFLRGVAERLRRMRGGPAPTLPSPPATHLPAPPPGRHLAYSPNLDGQADPGEIVWFWVRYEDDPTQGKDRPVLVVGRQKNLLLGLMLSSNEARDGQPNWFALGAGGWDKVQRPSWVRLDRVLRVPESRIRREGAVLDRRRFDAIAHHLRTTYHWQ